MTHCFVSHQIWLQAWHGQLYRSFNAACFFCLLRVTSKNKLDQMPSFIIWAWLLIHHSLNNFWMKQMAVNPSMRLTCHNSGKRSQMQADRINENQPLLADRKQETQTTNVKKKILKTGEQEARGERQKQIFLHRGLITLNLHSKWWFILNRYFCMNLSEYLFESDCLTLGKNSAAWLHHLGRKANINIFFLSVG